MIYYLLMVTAFLVVTMRRNKLPPRFEWFILIIGAGIATQVFDEFWYKGHGHPFFLFKVMHLVEYAGFTGYFWSVLRRNPHRIASAVSLPFFGLFYLLFFLQYPQLWNADGYTEFTLQAVLVSFFSVLVLLDIYRDDSLLQPLKMPDFWVVIAHLLYFPGSALIVGSKNYIIQNYPTAGLVLNEVHHYLNYILYAVYIVAFLKVWKKDTSSSSS